MAHEERQFRASTEGGELVGWLRDAGRSGTSGSTHAPPMLLLHGGPGLSEYMKPLADELDGLSRIARYQQRGLAPSVTSGARDVERHVADIVDVLNGLGWQKAVVIGHSWGGHLAMHFAVAQPERLTAFVAIDPLGGVDDGGLAGFVQNLNSSVPERDRPRQAELEALESPTNAERRESLGYVWPFYFADPAKAPSMPEFGFDPDAGKTWASINAHFEARTLEINLPRVAVPFLLIHGEKSPIPIDEVVKTAEIVPNARVVRVANCGHWPWLERPGFVRVEVEKLLLSSAG